MAMGLTFRKLVVSMVAVVLLFSVRCESGFLLHRTYVEIKNDLPRGMSLTIHCRSKEDDLGIHVLKPQETFGFRFRPQFWGITQFFCSMEWLGASYHYDVYVQNRDYKRCFDCLWSIKPEGPCLFNSKTQKYDLCYGWPKMAMMAASP